MPPPEPILPPAPDFAATSLGALAPWLAGDRPPPVDDWHPAHCGTIDIRITADGRWLHEGAPIRRPAMVRLFSRILRREADGSHVLVTPAERMTIIVEDAALLAVEMKVEGAGRDGRIAFRLETGDIVIADAAHPLRLRDGPAGRLPYLVVRGTPDRPIEARLARPVYYALADMADADGAVWSAGTRFVIGDLA